MPSISSLTEVQVEAFTFPPSVTSPGSTKSHFLGGAGERGFEIQGKFIKFTAIGVYLEDIAVPSLADKWRGKTAAELTESVEFFRDIVTGPFEKFIRVTMILPLTGQQYSEKVKENCVAIWKSLGIYTDAEAKAIEKFIEVFKDETFPPGSSILFTVSPNGSLTIGFSKDGTIPEVGSTVIENKLLAEAVLESIIGQHGVSPAAKQSLAARLPDLLKDGDEKSDEKSEAVLESIIGKHGVSPAAKQSLAARVPDLLKDGDEKSEAVLESIIGKHGVSPAAKQSLAARVPDLLKEDEKLTESGKA